MPETAAPSNRYRDLADRLARSMDAGAYRAGDRLPSVRELSRRERVSVATAVAAYRALEDRRLIEARPRSGYFVAARRLLLPEPDPPARPRRAPSLVGVSRLVMEITEAARDPRVYPLAAACPGGELMIPAERVARAVGARLRRDPGLATAYRMGTGYGPLRRAIARHAFLYGCTLDPDELIVTNGCMEALTIALRAVTRPGQTVAVETPTYFSLLQILESLGLRVLELPTHPRTGISVEALELATRRPGAIAAVVLTPNFSNPLGSLMPDGAKRLLLELLTERDIPLIEDDVYGDLYFGAHRPRPVKSWDRTGQVILCASFTKTLSPGLRIGWMAPGRWRDPVAMLKFTTSVTTPEMNQAAAAELMESGGFERQLRRLRAGFREQVERTAEAVSRWFPPGSRVTRPAGGFVLWIELPAAVDAMALFWRALEAGVSVAPGVLFSAGGAHHHHIRISCGNVFDAQTEAAIRTVGALAAEGLRQCDVREAPNVQSA